MIPFPNKMTEADAFAFLDEIKREIGDRLISENPTLDQPENANDLRTATELRFEKMRAAFKIDDEFMRHMRYLAYEDVMDALRQSDDPDPIPF